jgi:hypothetical protein
VANESLTKRALTCINCPELHGDVCISREGRDTKGLREKDWQLSASETSTQENFAVSIKFNVGITGLLCLSLYKIDTGDFLPLLGRSDVIAYMKSGRVSIVLKVPVSTAGDALTL